MGSERSPLLLPLLVLLAAAILGARGLGIGIGLGSLATHPLALSSLALFVAVYLLLLRVVNGKWSARKPTDPPLISGWIPYLGVALDFGARGDAFLAECAREYGPVFTLVLAGRRLTYVADASLWPGIIKDQAHWNFVAIGAEVGALTARIPPQMSYSVEDDAHRILSKWLLSDTPTLTKRFAARLEEFFSRELDSKAAQTVNLYALAGRAVFQAGLKALFGTKVPLTANGPDANYAKFNAYDDGFPLLAGGLPDALVPASARKARDELIELMDPPELQRNWSTFVDGLPGVSKETMPDPNADVLAVGPDDPSPFYLVRHLAFLAQGLHESDLHLIGKYDLMLLWAAQGNTAPASYWTLRNVLLGKQQNAKWYSELATEIDAAYASGFYDPTVNTPVLDACITESLRLSTSIFVIRQAVDPAFPPEAQPATGDPVQIPGTQFALPLGSRLVMPVRSGMHFNRELYGSDESPVEVFDPIRHVKAGPGLTGKRTLPFGSGYSMCPGRRFATNEIRCLVATLLKEYECELVEVGAEEFVKGRAGFGVQWPTKGATARIRRKD